MSHPNPTTTFLLEADELLTLIEEITVDLDRREPARDDIDRLFRAFHTIKGSGSMFGFDAVAAFTHHVESAFDKVRDGSLRFSRELQALVLAAQDQIRIMLAAGPAGTPVESKAAATIVEALTGLSGEERSATGPRTSEADPVARVWRIRFHPNPNLMTWGTDPLSLLDELRAIGKCTVVADTSAIPPLFEIDAESCYLKWEILLEAATSVNAIRDVFIFVEDSSQVLIEPAVESAVSSPDARGRQDDKPGSARTSQEPAASTQRKTWARESTVRVPSEKLDRLVNLVGELVMNQSRLAQATANLDAPDIAAPVEEIERLVAELRDNVLGIRMMPIGTTFNKFKRLVHDLSSELGKEVDLVTEGVETELDKTVLDQLGDPLVHLIRNSVDHGLEPADQRIAAGKPGRGVLRLAAVHTGSNVIVSITDDGRGLDKDAIRAKAIERKLIAADASLSDTEIFDLIFLPGFSTARTITGVSGRGVGMDVVRRQIDALRGEIAISSSKGQGTTISLTLPLTLAIIDGLLVEIDRDRFIVPMSVVTENVELQRAERASKNGRNLIAVRGDLIPYVRLREAFNIRSEAPAIEKVVVVRHQDHRIGLVVDRVLGSHQTVIQSLGRFYRNVDVFSGATIMGDGRAALIVDLGGVVRYVDRSGESSQSQAA